MLQTPLFITLETHSIIFTILLQIDPELMNRLAVSQNWLLSWKYVNTHTQKIENMSIFHDKAFL